MGSLGGQDLAQGCIGRRELMWLLLVVVVVVVGACGDEWNMFFLGERAIYCLCLYLPPIFSMSPASLSVILFLSFSILAYMRICRLRSLRFCMSVSLPHSHSFFFFFSIFVFLSVCLFFCQSFLLILCVIFLYLPL